MPCRDAHILLEPRERPPRFFSPIVRFTHPRGLLTHCAISRAAHVLLAFSLPWSTWCDCTSLPRDLLRPMESEETLTCTSSRQSCQSLASAAAYFPPCWLAVFQMPAALPWSVWRKDKDKSPDWPKLDHDLPCHGLETLRFGGLLVTPASPGPAWLLIPILRPRGILVWPLKQKPPEQ